MAQDNNKRANDHDLEFTEWLIDILNTCGVDGNIFEGYLGGALEELPRDASLQLIQEAIIDVMEAYFDDDSEQFTKLFTSVGHRWLEEKQKEREEEEARNIPYPPPAEVDPLPCSTHQSSSEGAVATACSNTEGAVGGLTASEKRQLVALYGCEAEEDYEMDDQELEAAGRYLNKLSVTEAGKLQRELQKATHLAKVERDRKSRDVQKQREQDRQDKEKKRTQKQERRR